MSSSKQQVEKCNEDLLSLRHEVLVRVIEALGAWESHTSSNTFQNKLNPCSAQEWIRQNHSTKCKGAEHTSPIMGCSGSKRNCHDMSRNTHLTLNPELSAKDQQKHRTHVLLKYLHRNDNDILGGSLIRIPSMQLDNPEDDDNNITTSQEENNSVGPSHPDESMTKENNASSLDSTQPPKPKMQASLLHFLEHSPPQIGSSDLPNHDLGSPFLSQSPEYLRQMEPPVSNQLEESTSVNLGRLLSFTRTSVPHAPIALLQSLSSSFSSLIQSHVKSWTILLLRQSLSSGDETSRKRLLKLLAVQNELSVNAMVTEFIVEEQQLGTILKQSDDALKRRESRIKKTNESGESGSVFHMEYCDLILPLSFKIAMDISFHDEEVTVHFSAPGSAGAIFHEDSEKITYLECKVDTKSLVKSMVEQMRLIVSQAVTRATANPDQDSKFNTLFSQTKLGTIGPGCSTVDTKDMIDPLPKQRNNMHERQSERNGHACSDSRQSINGDKKVAKSIADHTILSEEEPPSLLRQPGSFSIKKGIYKERSVQWDTDVKAVAPNHQDQKRTRQKGPVISRMVRSSKSFGRPGPDAFEPLRNATFSDFGHVSLSLSKKNASLHSKSPIHQNCNFLQKSISSPKNITMNTCWKLKETKNTLESHLVSTPSYQNNSHTDKKM
jgi:hypothetical protein